MERCKSMLHNLNFLENTMKKLFFLYVVLMLPAFLLVSCSEESSQLEALESANIHQPGVLDSTSANFHGRFFAQKNMKFSDCQKCHGKNLDGGITMAKSCSDCHSLATIHINMTGIQDTASSNFHGRYLLQHSLNDCAQCHGKSFAGGESSPSCVKCHDALPVHKTNFLDPNSADFHGKYPLKNKFTECQSCHGQNFAGGISSPTCANADCHVSIDVHKTGIVDTASVDFHGKYKFKNGFNDCTSCHGTTFSGGSQSPSCVTCHTTITIHKSGIVDQASDNFHGKSTLIGDFSQCKSCHGSNFEGGVNSPSCSNCHKSIDVHKTGIVDQNSANFHGKYQLKNGLTDCSSCHGEGLTGGTQSPSCKTCHATIDVHKSGIVDANSPNFHGKYQLVNGFSGCQSCHGNNFQGGNNAVACTTCHSSITVHKDGIIDPNSAFFHGKFIKANGWNLKECSSCHGSTFAGGTQSPTCTTSNCHNSAQGPLACNTCHGDFNNPSQINPPKDLDGNTATTFPGVGAHVKHLAAFANGTNLACTECHTVPSDVFADGHLGTDGKAELNFGSFTNKLGGSSYDFGTNRCSNTYCHGNFEFLKSNASTVAQNQYTADKMVGNNRSPKWNLLDGSEAKCSSCHGKSDTDPTPIGHVPYTIDQCVWCHSSVVDASGTIIDKTKHINGKANVFGTRFRK